MDSPEPSNRTCKSSTSQDSPYSVFVSNLSPIDQATSLRLGHGFSAIGFASPPPIFNSPRESRRELRILKRGKFLKLDHISRHSSNKLQDSKLPSCSETNDNEMDQTNLCSPRGIEDFITDPLEESANPAGSLDLPPEKPSDFIHASEIKLNHQQEVSGEMVGDRHAQEEIKMGQNLMLQSHQACIGSNMSYDVGNEMHINAGISADDIGFSETMITSDVEAHVGVTNDELFASQTAICSLSDSHDEPPTMHHPSLVITLEEQINQDVRSQTTISIEVGSIQQLQRDSDDEVRANHIEARSMGSSTDDAGERQKPVHLEDAGGNQRWVRRRCLFEHNAPCQEGNEGSNSFRNTSNMSCSKEGLSSSLASDISHLSSHVKSDTFLGQRKAYGFVRVASSKSPLCPVKKSVTSDETSAAIHGQGRILGKTGAMGIGLHLNSVSAVGRCMDMSGEKLVPELTGYSGQTPEKSILSGMPLTTLSSSNKSSPKMHANSSIAFHPSSEKDEEDKKNHFSSLLSEISDEQIPVPEILDHSKQLDFVEHSTLQCEMPSANGQSSCMFMEPQCTTPGKKKKRVTYSAENDGCKRCNCKKSKCLKLYCDCFAAGVYCADPCSCRGCFNKPDFEDKVQEARQQIESRNPTAFAPKVVSAFPGSPPRRKEDGSWITPASARHKRGCNCKKSQCQKKYCECYQAQVGCCESCRCEGCRNVYGRKPDNSGKLLEYRTDGEKRWILGVHGEPSMEARQHIVLPAESMIDASKQGHAPADMKEPSSPRDCSSVNDVGISVMNDETPEVLKEICCSMIKLNSPNKKRISPPHIHLQESRLSSPPELRNGLKFILQSVPSFPSLTPYSETKEAMK